jgi:hypothetical protein
MKNWKQSVFSGMVAIIALTFGFVGCDDKTSDPDPVEQYYDILEVKDSNNRSVNVRVTYTALPNTVPNYITGTLSAVVKEAYTYLPGTGNLTINVVTAGADGFIKTGKGILAVRESWISNPNIDQETKMGNLFLKIPYLYED